jgi:hypothetical protein
MSKYRYYDDYDDDYYYDNDYYWKADENKIKRDFMNYADPKKRKIDENGYEKMGKTLGIDIYTDIFITYFVYKCGSKQLEFITESEYMQGMKAFKCNTLNDVKSKIMKIREKLLEIHNEDFKNFYYFLFDLNVPGTEQEKKKKSLSLDIVEVYFKSLFCDQFSITKEFLQFLKLKNVGLKWDEWRTYLDFLQNQGTSFPKDYNPADFYPKIVDDFYYWYCEKHGIKIPDPDEEEL